MSRVLIPAAITLAILSSTAPLAAQAHIVNVPCCGFSDSTTLTNVTIVPVNATVQWNRIGITPHTVTSGTGPSDPNAGVLFNGSLSGPTTFSRQFTALGTFAYFCSFHFIMNMIGTVYVLPAASATVVGTGCASSVGTLALGTTGLPKVGNSTFGFTVSGGPAGAPAYLYLSLGIAPTPLQVSATCFAYLDLVSTNQFIAAGVTPSGPNSLSAGGTTTFTFPLALDPALGGISGAAQALIFDGAAPGGFALSNAVAVVVGA
jgi:hypothetical protein